MHRKLLKYNTIDTDVSKTGYYVEVLLFKDSFGYIKHHKYDMTVKLKRSATSIMNNISKGTDNN